MSQKRYTPIVITDVSRITPTRSSSANELTSNETVVYTGTNAVNYITHNNNMNLLIYNGEHKMIGVCNSEYCKTIDSIITEEIEQL